MNNSQIQKYFFNELSSFNYKNELAAIWKQILEFVFFMNPVVFITQPQEEMDEEFVFQDKSE